MELRNLTLNGFRRFRKADVRLEGPVIAIVGRNEAGKSTILEAVRLMNDDQPIAPTSLSERGDSSDDIIRLRMRLSADDQEEAASFAHGHRPTWLIIGKPASGGRRYHVEPAVPRSIQARHACAIQIKTALADAAIKDALPGDAVGEMNTLLPNLESKRERLPGDATQLLAGLEQRIAALDSDASGLSALTAAIEAAREEEAKPTTSQLGAHLAQWLPRFLPFEEAVRSLRSIYDLANDANRPALVNLLKAAGLDAGEIGRALDANDGGHLKSILDQGEADLARILSADWSQDSEIRVGLTVMDKRTLAITVTTNGRVFHGIGDRSDGLRSYIALRAFVANEAGDVPPVLLIDEAETHLHYDAQGDLVRMFEQQRDAAAVIYSTHSIACLPQDLGRGVRVVSRDPDSIESTVSNAWTADGAGVAPLLRAMGAATAILSPSRFLVLGEGPSEPAILPTIFRQALGLRSLPFQVVGRTSSASRDELLRLKDEGAKVVFILDGDKHGDERAEELVEIGFLKRQIVRLDPSFETEDLIEPGLYRDALVSHVKAWTGKAIPVDAVPSPGRVDQVDLICDQHGVQRQGHLDVVGEVLRQLDADETSALRAFDPTAKKQIVRVYRQILRGLGIADEDAAKFLALG